MRLLPSTTLQCKQLGLLFIFIRWRNWLLYPWLDNNQLTNLVNSAFLLKSLDYFLLESSEKMLKKNTSLFPERSWYSRYQSPQIVYSKTLITAQISKFKCTSVPFSMRSLAPSVRRVAWYDVTAFFDPFDLYSFDIQFCN